MVVKNKKAKTKSMKGAATTCYVALHPQAKGVSGEYFSDSNISKPTSQVSAITQSSSPASSSGLKKKVEDIMPIATGHEREELQAELQAYQKEKRPKVKKK